MTLSGLRVLVVDDDASNRELFAIILSSSGAEVLAAGSVAEAWALLSRYPPKVIVSDISMPGEDGYGLVERMRAGGFDIPVVAVTAYRYEHTRQHTLAAGFRAHFVKPVDPRQLCDTIAAIARAAS